MEEAIGVSGSALEDRLLREYGLRIDPEMLSYAAKREADPSIKSFVVIGNDVRTGIPRRQEIACNPGSAVNGSAVNGSAGSVQRPFAAVHDTLFG